jgi:hypothetical protein
LAIEKWQSRADLIEQETRDWGNGKDLPTASALGIPAVD